MSNVFLDVWVAGGQGEKFHSARGTGAISKNVPLSEALRDLWSLECQDVG